MRLVSWNVAHVARERPLHPGLLPAIAALEPDLLALNEYVHGPSRDGFIAGLADLGLAHVLTSQHLPGHNQVLVASRQRLTRGDFGCPAVPDTHATTNFLHVKFPEFEFIALRAPAYPRRRDLRAYWGALHALLAGARDRRLIVAGDLNADPERGAYVGTRHLRELEAAGWRIPRATGDWSCWTKAGRRSRIDHVLASPSAPEATASYATDGRTGYEPSVVSDHAALVVTLEPGASLVDANLPRVS